MFVEPLASFDLIERAEANEALTEWGHRHGPINRPVFTTPIDFGLRERGALVAVVCADTLIKPTCGFTRDDAFEVSRVCAARPGLSSTALRFWRQFAFPGIARAWFLHLLREDAWPWVISYQDAARHPSGSLYRGDGWLVLNYSTGGPDVRARSSTASVKRRLIWGWTPEYNHLAQRRAAVAAAREAKPWPTWAERVAA